jgi:hypothetical protein
MNMLVPDRVDPAVETGLDGRIECLGGENPDCRELGVSFPEAKFGVGGTRVFSWWLAESEELSECVFLSSSLSGRAWDFRRGLRSENLMTVGYPPKRFL